MRGYLVEVKNAGGNIPRHPHERNEWQLLLFLHLHAVAHAQKPENEKPCGASR
jgi:hypothetical protein